ncbi:MAG: mandelate racemase/muconate lactonizing enzyme family protein [Planctomycetes bacterium]|nr:mandelate racemase/muconate lactonizing enzyme family protein [Planctomycetota bacterium]
MRITQLDSQLLRLPLTRPLMSSTEGDNAGRLDHISLLVIHVDTDAGHRGLGFAYTLQGGGRALKVLAEDDLAPLLVGEDPLDHERLAAKFYWRLQTIGRRGLAAQAYSAVDLALWDLKGKAAGLPLYKLLGGARESAPVYAADTGWLWMSPDEIIAAARPYLDQGMLGIKVRVGGPNPEADAERVARIREVLGEDIWLGVDANQRYDYATALSMGHFFEEEMGVDWFEDPLSCEDVEGHARLADRLEIPIAMGETLFAPEEFRPYLATGAVAILRPDVTRVGGLTPWLKVAALAEQHHRRLSPHWLPEVGVHLACGLPHVQAVEYLPWLFPAFVEPPALVEGKIVPPPRPGLGLEIRSDAVEKYRVPG